MFYTYAHYTPEGRLFYIGKGSGNRRAYNFHKRNAHWKSIVAKYGNPDVQILAHWDTEEEAFDHERLLISCFRDLGHKLCNLTDGGEGPSGSKHSEETKAKLSAILIGNTRNLGVKRTEEEKIKISLFHKGNKYNLGRPASEKQRQVASQTHKGNKHSAGKINSRKWKWIGTHIITGEIIAFDGSVNLTNAGFNHANVISCINGTRKSHKGYSWSREKWEDKLWH